MFLNQAVKLLSNRGKNFFSYSSIICASWLMLLCVKVTLHLSPSGGAPRRAQISSLVSRTHLYSSDLLGGLRFTFVTIIVLKATSFQLLRPLARRLGEGTDQLQVIPFAD